jgi:glucosamine--fructose-6-phosphate aminotransferase (isomerizing)
MVAARRGSPLLLGVKTAKKLTVDFVDVNTSDAPEATPSADLTVDFQVCLFLNT